ncbi:MAG: sulfite exporter TauE/SafE family protein [Hyphomicrobiaceae bacterium]|nr:sulfite exporter TauE/SafE family protein [Hyphomicrobiaceae bacterium]
MDIALNEPLLLLSAAGLVVGFLVGLTGVGAGAITTPMLITIFGIPPAVAVGTDLLFAAITKASAALRHHRLGNVDWQILKWLAAGSLSAALLTLLSLVVMAADTANTAATIRAGLAIVLVASAIIIPLCPYILKTGMDASDIPSERRLRPKSTLAFGLVLGVLVTLTSVGAGAIGVAALSLLYPALLARRIVGTDVVHAIPLAFVSGLGHLGLGNIDWLVLAALLAGSIPGIAIGSRLTGFLPDWLLRLGLSAMLLYAAYLLMPFLRAMLAAA